MDMRRVVMMTSSCRRSREGLSHPVSVGRDAMVTVVGNQGHMTEG